MSNCSIWDCLKRTQNWVIEDAQVMLSLKQIPKWLSSEENWSPMISTFPLTETESNVKLEQKISSVATEAAIDENG